ncbi:hypothetical protein BGZ68_009804 [Mortierella alpina]|nr:hypothetical protein BGZ68_009804 [Mortierella alpina]
MSVLFGRKTAGTKLSNINYARGLVISLYLVSWAFSFMATHLVQTNNFNNVSCTMSIYTCILLYAASKIIIYLFLMEKVYVVTAVGLTRKNFMLYKVNMVLMVPYLGIVALMIIYRVAEIGQDGHCRIGLLKPAALPLILYDMVLSIWLTLLFIRPLMSSKSLLQGPSKGKLRDVARRTLIGAIVAMILSSANVFTLVYFQGYERGLICLSSYMDSTSVKACAAKGRRECTRGFIRDNCQGCTRGSVSCNMCTPSTSFTCNFCVKGRRECDDCYGIGFIQRICQDCIKQHYRRQRNNRSSTTLTTKVKDQLNTAQQQFSKSMTSLSGNPSSPTSSSSGQESDSDDVSSDCSSKSNRSKSSLRSVALKFLRIPSMVAGTKKQSGEKAHRRKWSWSSSNSALSLPVTSAAA